MEELKHLAFLALACYGAWNILKRMAVFFFMTSDNIKRDTITRLEAKIKQLKHELGEEEKPKTFKERLNEAQNEN